MTRFNKIIRTALIGLVVFISSNVLSASKAPVPAEVAAKKTAIAFYEQGQGISIPEFRLFARAYQKMAGHVVILKRVDTASGLVLDDVVAIYHVIGESVTPLDFVTVFLKEIEEGTYSSLFLDIEYGLKTQIKRELDNGNSSYLQRFVERLESLDNESIAHFMDLLKDIDQVLKFGAAQGIDTGTSDNDMAIRVEVLLQKSQGVRGGDSERGISKEILRQQAMEYYLAEVQDLATPVGTPDGVNPQVKEEKSLTDGGYQVTFELFGGIAGMSLGNERTYTFNAEGTLIK